MNAVIKELYPDHFDEIIKGIAIQLERFKIVEKNPRSKLDHTDCILITYGDAFFETDIAPLETLQKFADTFLSSGISAIHLLPCFPYTSDDGFSVVDYYKIDPNLGDWSHIGELRKSFDLMFDAVVNHMSKDSNWFRKYLENESPFENYFITADPNVDYSAVVRPRALPLLHEFSKSGKTAYIWTTFSEDQVDLNYKNHRVFLHILDVLLFYIAKGAKYIRLDAIAFLWKKKGTSCIHLDETHKVIQLYRHYIERVAPETVLITETNVPHKENLSYFGNGYNEAHMVYNFTLPPLLAHSLHEEDVTALTQWANSIELPSNRSCFFNFTASHDGVGVRPLQGIVSSAAIYNLAEITENHGGYVSYKDNGDGSKSPYELNCNYMDLITDPRANNMLRSQRFLLTQSVMLTMPGVPGIYYHSLLGSENDKQAVLTSGIPRRINRAKLSYAAIAKTLKENTDSLQHRIYTEYMKLLQIRKSEIVFTPYGRAVYHQIGKVFVIERSFENERLFALHNFSSTRVSIQALAPQVKDLREQQVCGTPEWTLNPFEFRWLKNVEKK